MSWMIFSEKWKSKKMNFKKKNELKEKWPENKIKNKETWFELKSIMLYFLKSSQTSNKREIYFS